MKIIKLFCAIGIASIIACNDDKQNQNAAPETAPAQENQVKDTKPMITLYSKPSCPYCVRAKALLDQKGVTYETINVGADPQKAMEMIKKSNGRRTVPQIFINDEHIGGYDDLKTLDDEGKLDAKLGL